MLKNRTRGLGQREGGEKENGDPNQAGRMGDRNETERAAGVGRDGGHRGFDWPGFFRNPRVMLQFILYMLLLYTIVPGPLTNGPLFVCLLLILPLFVLSLMGTHMLTEWAAKREKLANMRVGIDYSVAEDGSNGLITG